MFCSPEYIERHYYDDPHMRKHCNHFDNDVIQQSFQFKDHHIIRNLSP